MYFGENLKEVKVHAKCTNLEDVLNAIVTIREKSGFPRLTIFDDDFENKVKDSTLGKLQYKITIDIHEMLKFK